MTKRNSFATLSLWLATLGPIGRMPASGTIGSAAALVLFIPVCLFATWRTQVMLVVLASLVGILICALGAKHLKAKDPSAVVWDELAGMWLALVAAPWNPLYWALALALFRLLDIVKPGPVGWCDRRLNGGAGIMMDDLAAGAITLGCMQAGWWLYGLIGL